MISCSKKKCLICATYSNLLCEKCVADKVEETTDAKGLYSLESTIDSVLGVGIRYHEDSMEKYLSANTTEINIINRVNKHK